MKGIYFINPVLRSLPMTRRVVITGVGAVSAVGKDTETTWKALIDGVCGIGRITLYDAQEHPVTIAGEVTGFEPDLIDPKEAKRMDRYCQLALTAAQMAYNDSGLNIDDSISERAGVIIGSGIGGISTYEKEYDKYMSKGPKRVSPFLIPMMIGDMASGLAAIRFNAKGPNMDIVSACASGAHSIGEAYETIKRGDADIMITGGAEAPITKLTVSGFASMKALSTRNDAPEKASRPFDKERDGFVIAEGAGVIILEEYESAKARNAKIYAELAGYGATADAYHMTAPRPDGDGAARAMQIALEKGNCPLEDVNYINAHGTSTPLNDKIETAAIKKLFKEHAYNIAVSSTKGMTGHLLGAAGPLEAVIVCKAIADGIVPPTINYENPDPDCDLDYVPNKARKLKIKAALSNSFGFGGHNASLLFKRID
jgi:3-oxoacyl-[acyl-carrier-protein] synthase II